MKSLKAYRNIQTGFNTARQTETVIAEDYEGYCIEFEEDDEVYLKSEADKVIAELEESHKKEIEQLLIEIAKLNEGAQNLILDNYSKANKLRYSNYKRCLDNAKYWVAVFYQSVDDRHRRSAERHHYKWLEIAKQFKEAK